MFMANSTDVPHTRRDAESLPSDFSVAQIAAFLAFFSIFLVYAYSAALRWRYSKDTPRKSDNVSEQSNDDGRTALVDSVVSVTSPVKTALSDPLTTVPDMKDRSLSSPFVVSLLSSPLTDIVCLNHVALVQQQQTIDAMAEFSMWMILFLISDRTQILRSGEKSYSRDVFLTAFAAVIAVSFGSFREEKRAMTLSRHQTEEWKGWMQVMFLLYHYFQAREAYNAIRVLIAAYVWMTGYGNFHYYYRTSDFCIGRFAQMMWRLNFLVFVCCIVLRNDYMLYYICPMHTVFTVFVYAALGIASHLNSSRVGMMIKLMACVVVVMVVWDIPAVFYAVWRPFTFFVKYSDPRNPNPDNLHEWFFRSSLDRYIWIMGMVAAWIHPQIESSWAKIDSLGSSASNLCRMAILLCCLVLLFIWYTYVYTLEKLEYNLLHPYTSWVPISLWVIVRNVTPQLRQRALALLSWLGCITLETYVSQFHIWLRSNIPNGQPKYLLELVPGYPLLNFLLASILYVGVSRRLFTLTNILKLSFVPHDNNRLLARNATLMTICAAILYCTALVIHSFVYQSF